MKDHDRGDEWPPMASRPRPDNRYTLFSLAAPFLGVLAALAVLLVTGGLDAFDNWPDMTKGDGWRATIAVVTLATFGLGGLASACVAIARREGLMILSIFGMILNAPLPLLFLRAGVQSLRNWWDFG